MTMQPPLPNYIRSLRRGACLTQRELAWLAGGLNHSRLSRYESFDSMPDIQVAFAIAFIFGLPLKEVFPQLIEETEDEVARRAYRMLQVLEQQADGVDVMRKCEVLSLIPRRGGHPNLQTSHEPRT